MRDKSLAMLTNSRLARSCRRAAVTAVERDLPGVPESVGEARQTVRQLLADSPAAEAAAVCVSELVTNAIAYSRSGGPGGTVRVTARLTALTRWHQVHICVRDQGSRFGTPALASSPPGTEHGYGLRIVAALAAEWGTAPVLHGTRTWCLIRWEGDQ
jgi:anti-sigma regulatory factor (Ser/Thr protein kinase)